MKSNAKAGAEFEQDLQEKLSRHGFWVLRIPNSTSGQPADLIAVKRQRAFLIDCKVCEKHSFKLDRIEENQWGATQRWQDCGNGDYWFAIKMNDHVFMMSTGVVGILHHLEPLRKSINFEELKKFTQEFDDWVREMER